MLKIKNPTTINEKDKSYKIEKILNKWSSLQKIIKEEMILKDVIINQQKIVFNKIKKNVFEYYNIKLKIRKLYEDMDSLKNKDIIFETNVNYNDKLKSISELFFFLRNNYDYIIKLSELIELNNDNSNYMDSIAALFCHQFYENILIPNPEQEELLLLIYKLIEKDISKNNNTFNIFLDNNTFLGKFIKYLLRKSEIKTFISKLLNPIILTIEKDCSDIDMSFYEFETDENISNNIIDENSFINLYDSLKKKYYKNESSENKEETYLDKNNDMNISSILDDYIKEKDEKHLDKIKTLFLLIKQKIDILLQSLIEKITAIPYIIKCICKIIYLLISQRYHNSNNYIFNLFIGKFIFEKCILLSLTFEDNNIIENRIYNSKTKYFLKIIFDVLLHGIRYHLFQNENNSQKIFMNYYLIKVIPILEEIYQKLIDVKLPNFLNSLSEKKIKKFNYKYFKENKDEILFLQSICISVDDILFILDIISKNITQFKQLKEYNDFYKIINNIEKGYEKDIVKIMANPNKNIFFVLFNEIYKSKLNKVFRYYKGRRSSALLLKENQEEKIKYKKIKICIKKILKCLNDINSKSYTYLNYATTNEKFLTSLMYTLKDLQGIQLIKKEKNENNFHIIPLKWYGQYLNNNKNYLDASYKQNDFQKLYDEIMKEESDNLKKLKLYSDVIISRNGMNLICSEKIIEKEKNDLIRSEISKKFKKIESFIDSEKIEVCIRIKNEEIKKELKKKLKKNKLIDDNPPDIIISEDMTFCNHKKMEEIECLILKDRKKIPSHSFNIKNFIQKFSDNPWYIDKYNKDKKPKDIIINEIEKGERNCQIYKTLDNYMSLIKKRINENEEETDEMIKIIKNFILRQIYKYITPKNILKEDIQFYNKTLLLDWIQAENLEIKKSYVEQISSAEMCIKNFDNAESIYDKLNYIKDAFTYINNNIKYSTGKNEEAGQDEILPIFQFILIKSNPKRIKTNINYINCFLSEEEYDSQLGYFLSQIESSFTFIMKLGYKEVNLTQEEFDENIKKAKIRHSIA